MPGMFGGGQNAQPQQPRQPFGPQLKQALITAAPMFNAMAAGYASGRGPYAYMDQGAAAMQEMMKRKRDEEAADAAAAAFGGLAPPGGNAGGTGWGGGYGGDPYQYTPGAPLPKANAGVYGGGQGGLSFGGKPAADPGVMGGAKGGLGFHSKGDGGAAGVFRAELLAGGLPAHVVDGILMNAQDESAFNPTAVGDNGAAFGLLQWNGPRKAALERFAAEKGGSPADPRIQAQFTLYELNGPEKGAFNAVMSAKNAGEAGAAFVNHFERPAEEHRASRERKYLGAGGAPASGGTGGGAPAAADPLSDPYVQELMQVMAMPGLTPEQRSVVELQLNNRVGQLTAPNPAAEEERARARRARDAEMLGLQPGTAPFNQYVVTGEMPSAPKPLEVGGVLLDPVTNEVLFDSREPPKPEAPTTKQVKLPDGSEVMVQWNPETQVWDAAPIPEGGTTGTGAAATTVGQVYNPNEIQSVIGMIDSIYNDPNLPSVVGNKAMLLGGGNDPEAMNSMQKFGYGAEGLDTIERIGQLQSNAWLSARAMLKGGGPITDYESRKAEAAVARLGRAKTVEDYQSALKELRDAITEGEAKLRGAQGVAVGGTPQGATAPITGTTSSGVTWSLGE